MRVRFWPLLIGVLVIIWGVATIAAEILHIRLEISWWAIMAIILGLWILTHSFQR